jgi:hypothetical protein
MAIFLTVTTTIAPVGASFIFDRFGTYQVLLVIILCGSVTAMVTMAIMKSEPSLRHVPTTLVETADLSGVQN